jgi:hypothetical protein
MRSVARRSVPLLVAVTWLVAACSGVLGPADAPGGSVAPPALTCTEVPQAKCDEQAATFFRSLPNEHPTRIEVVCVAPPCTEETGTTIMNITYADGHQLHSNPVSWSGPGGGNGGGGKPGIPVPGGPDLPIVPTCIGVPQDMCFQMATSSGGDGTHGVPISIVVRCDKVCTATAGEGTTTTTYKDGTVENGGWGYSNSG